jgi:hypothetical protein
MREGEEAYREGGEGMYIMSYKVLCDGHSIGSTVTIINPWKTEMGHPRPNVATFQ